MIYTGWVKRTVQPWPRVHLLTAVVLLLASLAGDVHGQKRKVSAEAKQQWEFGVDMASRGLWSEALFRFEQARRLEPDHPEILSNIAVAHEALGLFEEALDYYRQALRLAPRERSVRRNYSRFVEYYQNFKGDAGEEEGEEAAARSATEAAPDAATAGRGGLVTGEADETEGVDEKDASSRGKVPVR